MALYLLNRAQQNSIPVASDDCFTKQNYGAWAHTSTTLSVNTPRGVLGGSVAAVSAGLNYTAVPCTTTLQPIGLFMNDAAGAAFENSPAVASGKIAIVKAMASVEVDVYETTDSTNVAIHYTVGDYLYSSDQNLLTNEAVAADPLVRMIGLVTKAPSLASPTLGLDMRI